MRFDQCAQACAVNIIDALKVNDNARRARCEEIVNGCTKAIALLSEHKTPFEYQKVDAVHFTLCYFQWHGRLSMRLPKSISARSAEICGLAMSLADKPRASMLLAQSPAHLNNAPSHP